ncbi:MAG TPA: FtsK/SpoIIIE domain-containing protein [Actinophytocola sp.]|uniref:FtsK/SpoIIIE domain-containing protein n=1 Tax=Actinophytocola sp. TaxID=1872138 RepID=UPI002DDD6ABE|nr:FtsK/SpoIIIE domain-containing protein [Actinophytocola sp.]HEV2780928.1 FtsK/SpoIIIE domain-containing protein [Actinophytocola sp.]
MTEIELVCVGPDGVSRPVVVTAAPSHRIADLTAALAEHLGDRAAGPLYLGTMPVPGDVSVADSGLANGAVVGVGQPLLTSGHGVTSGEIPEISVVGGLHGGPSRLLYPGTELRLGRGPEADLAIADPEVSRVHATISVGADGVVWLADANSHNGIRWQGWRLTEPARLAVGDVAGLGETVLGLRPTVLADADVTAEPGNGTRWFNRPPRISMPEPPHALLVPVEPDKPSGFRFPWIAVLLPLLFGGGLYVLLPNAGYFLLIMLLSPVMVLANLIGDRRSGRREYAARKKEYDLALETFRGALAAACAADERRARAVHPDPSWVAAAACAPSARLWERRPSDPDFLRLRLGLHDRQAELRLRFDPRYPQPRGGSAELPAVPTVRDVPATVELRRVGVLGMAGERRGLLAAARAVVTQAGGLHAPRDLGVVVITGQDESADWEWATWLPHTRPSGPTFGSSRLVATDGAQAESRLSELRALVAERLVRQRSSLRTGRSAGREFLVVVDGARRMRGLPGLAELLADGPTAGVYALCLDDDETALPAECGATAVLTSPSGSRARLRRADLPVIEDLLVDGLEPGHAMRMALALAPLDTLGVPAGAEALPERVRFTELAGLAISGRETDGELVRAAWAGSPEGRSTTAVLGVGPSGPLTVDLRRDGPHALIAGTSGAGKSELLQTLIASLAVRNMPDALTFVLVDYKGGSAFAACAELPHCVGLITDLDGHLVGRALDSLSAELRRREKLLADAEAKDIDDYWARTGDRLPRLVIVVDEFASLIEEVPEFVPGVVGIGMRGRSLGVHVVLATQRPGGVVTADLRANLNLRICLRVTAESESVDVIDAPDAARITSRQPGRAYLRTGHGDLTAFQAARVGWPRAADAESPGPEPVSVRPRRTTELGRSPRAGASAAADVDADGHTDLTALVAASRVAARQLGLSSPRRPWLPPLPDVVTAELSPGSQRPPLCVLLGLVDRPTAQAQDAFELDLERTGPIAVGGTVRTGRSTALRAIAAGLCAATGPDTVHIYGLDCGNRALAPLAELPHSGAIVDAEDSMRVARLLDWLDGEVRRRQRVLAGGYSGLAEQRRAAAPADRLPYLILLLDRLEGFRSAFDEHDGGRLVELLEGLLRRGPAVGLVTVLSTDRTAFGPRIATAIEHRLVLRQADRDDVAVFGLSPRAVPARMPAGRAIWTAAGEEVQLPLLDADPSGAAQIRALAGLAARLRAAADDLDPALLPHRIDPLPDRISIAEAEALRGATRSPAATVCTPAVGGDHAGPVDVDLAEVGGTFVVAGPGRSGRSSTLATIVHGLAGRPDGRLPVVLVTPRPSPLRQVADLAGVLGVTTGAAPAEFDDLVLSAGGPVAVVVDDGELVDELALGEALERFLLEARETGSVLVAAATTDDLLINRYRGWLAQARRARSGLLLNPASHLAGEVFDVRLSRSMAGGWPPGRGLLVLRGQATLAQVPLHLTEDLVGGPGDAR